MSGSPDLIEEIYPVRVVRCPNILPAESLTTMRDRCLEIHNELHPHRVAFGRPDKTSIDIIDAETFKPAFDILRSKVEEHFEARVIRITGRESILYEDGGYIPTHCEQADLSAILFLQYDAKPNPSRWDYNGMFVLSNPNGAWGIRNLPWEQQRSHMIAGAPGLLVIHPSYVPHYSCPYFAKRPGVEIHFEIWVEK